MIVDSLRTIINYHLMMAKRAKTFAIVDNSSPAVARKNVPKAGPGHRHIRLLEVISGHYSYPSRRIAHITRAR